MHGEEQKLTDRQRRLLAAMPHEAELACDEPPLFCKGPNFRVARRLEKLGLVSRIKPGLWGGAYFARRCDAPTDPEHGR